MARPLRIEFPGAFYHVTSRGNEKKAIFRSVRDREKFLSYLGSAHTRYGAIIHVFCLMENHYHLLLETPRGNLSQILHHINGAYTTYFNVKRGRSGHLFQGRFKGILVDRDAYCKELSRYIHLNPLRVGLVKSPSEYPWSSYNYYIGREREPEWLEMGLVLGYFGRRGRKAFKRYRDFVEKGATAGVESPLKKVIASTFLGDEDFINRIRQEYLENRDVDKRNIPAVKELLRGPCPERIENVLTKVVGKGHDLYRKICIYMIHQYSGLSLGEAGKYLGMEAGAVSQSSRRFKVTFGDDKSIKKILDGIKKELNVES
ncbi:MAG: hypothetical protein A2V86_07025 [Deltaproteobacteria bacterium RBG_16_49_23]|nr:MAG: hypothetical protein A2V86_07025 [Deltaproteobacteria bacterium RBG_16_49_23]